MSGSHKHPPIGFRPAADSDDREWLLGYAARTGRAVNSILTEALRLFRAQQGGTTPAAVPPERGKTTCTRSSAPVAAGDEQPEQPPAKNGEQQ